MKTLILSPTLLAFGMICLFSRWAVSQELLDPGGLSLQVATVERTSDSVLCTSSDGNPGIAMAEPGGKFVRVVLRGQATRPGNLILPDSAFYAVFDKKESGSHGKIEKGIANAAALCLDAGVLMFASPSQFREYSVTPGPIAVTLLFAIPQEVNRFEVIYPALVKGSAILGAKTAARHPPTSEKRHS